MTTPVPSCMCLQDINSYLKKKKKNCSKSLVYSQNQECPPPHEKGNQPILPWMSHHRINNHQQTKHSSPRRIQKAQQSIQQSQIPETSFVHSMGSCYRTMTRSTQHLTRKATPSHSRRKEWNAQICTGTPQKGNNPCIQITYSADFSFVKKKDEKLWPVQDYRPISKWTKKNRNVSLLIPQVIDCLSGCINDGCIKFTIVDIC